MKFSRCFCICEATCVEACPMLGSPSSFSLEANWYERHILSAEGKVGSLLLTYHLMRCLPLSLLSRKVPQWFSYRFHNWWWASYQLPLPYSVLGFFLECFTVFWGAVLSYCMWYYRLLESAEVSVANLTFWGKKPKQWILGNFKLKMYLRNRTENCCAFSLWNSSFTSKLYLIQCKFGVRKL